MKRYAFILALVLIAAVLGFLPNTALASGHHHGGHAGHAGHFSQQRGVGLGINVQFGRPYVYPNYYVQPRYYYQYRWWYGPDGQIYYQWYAVPVYGW